MIKFTRVSFKKAMKIHLIILNLSIVILAFTTSPILLSARENKSTEEKESLSLEDFIRIAKLNNPRIIQARNELGRYRAILRQKYSSRYPNIDLSSSHSQSRTIGTDTIKEYSHSVELAQDVFKGGGIYAEIEEAKAGLDEKVSEYREIELDEIFEIKNTYYQILKIKHLINVYQDIVRRRKGNADLIRLLYKAGREQRANLLRAESEIAKAELNLSQAENDLKIYKLKLNQLMGRDLYNTFRVKRKLQKTGIQASIKSLVRFAIDHRPELTKQRAKIRQAKANLKQARSGLLPSLSLSAGYNFFGEDFSPDDESWNANIRFSLPLFDGFLSLSKINESKLEAENLHIEYKNLEKEIALEVNEAYLDLINSKKRFEVAKQYIKAAQEKADLSRLEYKQGAISYRSLEIDELSLTQAELDYVDALYDLSISMAQLNRALGK